MNRYPSCCPIGVERLSFWNFAFRSPRSPGPYIEFKISHTGLSTKCTSCRDWREVYPCSGIVRADLFTSLAWPTTMIPLGSSWAWHGIWRSPACASNRLIKHRLIREVMWHGHPGQRAQCFFHPSPMKLPPFISNSSIQLHCMSLMLCSVRTKITTCARYGHDCLHLFQSLPRYSWPIRRHLAQNGAMT